jgi:hypothetical protein
MSGDAHFVDEGSPSHVNALGQRDTFSCRIVSKDGSYTPAMGAAVEVTDDVGLRFGGSIREKTVSQFGVGVVTEIQCASWEAIFDRRYVGEQKSFVDEPAGNVFQYVFDNWLTFENLTASIVATGPNISVSFDWCTVREAFDLITQQASNDTDTFMWDCTPSKVSRFYKQSSFAAPMNVTGSSTDVMRPITINQSFGGSGVGYANKAFVDAAELITEDRINTFGPDGVLTSFVFELPLAGAPTITLDTGGGPVAKTVGIRDVDTGKDFYWQDRSPEITAAVAPANGSTLEVTAKGYQRTVVDAGQNDTEVTARSVAENNSGWYQILIPSPASGTYADKLAIGQAALSKYSGGVPRAVEYVTITNGCKAGQYQTINLPGFGETVNSTFIIESVTLFQVGPNYGFRVRAVNGALANGWLQKIRQMASGGSGASAVGGGTIVTPGATTTPPGNVTITSVTPDARPIPIVNARGTSKGTQRGVEIRYAPPSPIGTFAGTLWQIEEPDQSAEGSTPLDGSVALDGSTNLGGPKEPLTFGPFAHSDVNGILRVVLPEPRVYPMSCRARALSYSDTVTNDASTSPSLVFAINAPSTEKPDAGTAYCENPLSITVLAMEQPPSVAAIRREVLLVTYVPPADPKFVGVQWVVKDAAGETINASGIEPATEFTLEFDSPTSQQTCTVYACGSDGVNVNPLVEGITPSATVTLGTDEGVVDLSDAVTDSFDDAEFEVYQDATGKWRFRMKGVPLDKAFNFNTAEFKITPGVGMEMFGVDFAKGFGGFDAGGSAVPKITVSDNGTPLGWIGRDTVSGYAGAWFKRVTIGGSSPANAPLFADSSGNVVATGLLINSASSPLGWIGASGGYAGAWFKRIYIGGTDPSTAKIVADSGGNVAISGSLIVGSISGSAGNITGTLNVSQIGSGSLPAGVVYAGTINCTQLAAGTISAAVTMTSPSLQISMSGATLSIDATNGVYFSGSNVRVQIKESSDGFGFDGLRVSRASDSYMNTLRADGATWVAGSVALGYTQVKYGEIRLRNSSGQETIITPTSISVNGRVL